MAEQHAAANARASGDIHNHFHNLQASNVGVIGGTQHVAAPAMVGNPEFVHPVLPMATAVGEQLDDEPSLDKEWADELMALKIQLRASQARAFSKQKAVLLKEIKALDAAEGGGGGGWCHAAP